MADNRRYRKSLPSLTRPDQDNTPRQDPFRCCSGGCVLRADIFPGQHGIGIDGARGLCTYHLHAERMDKDPVDVTTRLRERIELHRAFMRLSVAKVDLRSGKYRATVLDLRQDPPCDVLMTYPERMPIRDNEHHHEWVDRARQYLIEVIVGKAAKSREAA